MDNMIETKRNILKRIKEAEAQFAGTGKALLDIEDYVAEYLTANGVIVPPCKVGDTVYFPTETDGECEPYADVGTVFAIGVDEGFTMWISVRYESGLRYYHVSDDFGKTVFLTRELAEEKLNEQKKL